MITARAPELRDFGHEPEPNVLDILRTLVRGTDLSPGARALVETAARGKGDRGIQRLLPMMHDQPAAQTLGSDTREHLRLHYLKTRARFVVLETVAQRIVAAMTAEDIRVVFLKGFALARDVYASPIHRPMGDLDVAVPPERYADAARVLAAIGFALIEGELARGASVAGVSTHALGFRSEETRVSVDLHHNLLRCSLWSDADAGFWREVVPLRRASIAPALTLAPEHHVFHACMHGYSRSLLQLSIRWMIDAHLVLVKLGDRFRWELIEEEAKRHRCGPLLAATLRYLAQHLDSPVPREWLARLAALPMPRYDIAYFQDAARYHERDSVWLRMRMAWNSSQRQAGRRFWTPLPFAHEIARRWGATSPLRLATIALRRVKEPSDMRARRQIASSAGGIQGKRQ
jgi:hypothetical protein